METQQAQAQYAATVIRAFVDGTGSDWDWDDFISCPLHNSAVDSIRRRAAAALLPASPAERRTLFTLIEEADRLAASDGN